MKTVTLHCEIGNHDWERPSQRGKRPKNCPEHTLVESKPEVIKANYKTPDHITSLLDNIEQSLNVASDPQFMDFSNPMTQKADQYNKLTYIEKRLASDNLDAADERLLLSTRKDILAKVE